MKIISVVGARPNFIKIAPFINAIEEHNLNLNDSEKETYIHHILVHTGQHYDNRMNESFFTSLGIPTPDINFCIGSGTHAEQVGKTMIAFEEVLVKEKPDMVVVVGDVNATLACSVTAKKEKILCCHIEAGLRSGDMTMPEEINRLVTDRLSDLLLTPDLLSNENLKREGIDEEKIHFVGNIMIDTLEKNLEKAKDLNIIEIIKKNKIVEDGFSGFEMDQLNSFALITMHRPSNVDNKAVIEPIIDFYVNDASEKVVLIWPIHPRTYKQLKEFSLIEKVLSTKNIILLHPITYHEMLRLNIDASIMFTDSGGLQEECSILGTPCLTMRWNTERPITLREHGGPSVLVGNDVQKIKEEFYHILHTKRKPRRPKLWDGNTAKRCLDKILERLTNKI